MKRLIIICEGPTEQEFCKHVLVPYFYNVGIRLFYPLIRHSHGGIVCWNILKKEIETYLKNEKKAFVTTFIDYYGLYSKHDFPLWEKAESIQIKNRRIDTIEDGMKRDISDTLRDRFIPYIQLHEFEGLLFNNINVFTQQIPLGDLNIEELEQTINDYPNPEMINNGAETSPSHRLEKLILGYNKIVYGAILAETIGLTNIRTKCPRFNMWICQLENI